MEAVTEIVSGEILAERVKAIVNRKDVRSQMKVVLLTCMPYLVGVFMGEVVADKGEPKDLSSI